MLNLGDGDGGGEEWRDEVRPSMFPAMGAELLKRLFHLCDEIAGAGTMALVLHNERDEGYTQVRLSELIALCEENPTEEGLARIAELAREAKRTSVNALAAEARLYNAKVKRILLQGGVPLRTKSEQNRIAGTQRRRILSEETLRALYARYQLFEPLRKLAVSVGVEYWCLLQEFRD